MISTRRLRRDLEEWDTLYVAGRLHKPVRREKQFSPSMSETSVGPGSSAANHSGARHPPNIELPLRPPPLPPPPPPISALHRARPLGTGRRALVLRRSEDECSRSGEPGEGEEYRERPGGPRGVPQAVRRTDWGCPRDELAGRGEGGGVELEGAGRRVARGERITSDGDEG